MAQSGSWKAAGQNAWAKWALAGAGAVLLAIAIRRVDWQRFSEALRGIDWRFALGSLVVSASAIALRALRLSVILDEPGAYRQVWRAVALGNLGTFLLPMGGGEVTKVVALRTFLGRPAPAVATGSVLDRLCDVLGLACMLIVLLLLGTRVQLRSAPLILGGAAAAGLATAMGAVLVVQRRREASGPGRTGRFGAALDHIARTVAVLGSPLRVARLLALQTLVTCLDLFGIYVGFQAFPFTHGLPIVGALKLGAFLMLGAALPLLPGGVGTHQIACMLALQPMGVTATEAFAFSLVGQGLTFLMIAALGVVAVMASRRPESADRG